MSKKPVSLFIIASEHSGDLHGAKLALALKALDPGIQIRGLGGQEMERAGVRLIDDMTRMAIIGIPGIGTARAIWKIMQKVVNDIRNDPPDAVVMIDSPDFNLGVLPALGVLNRIKEVPYKKIYYITPQVWAWRKGRIKTMASQLDHAMVIFGFEEELFKEAGLQSTFVGHPLLDTLAEREAAFPRGASGLKGKGPLVGLLPGSRKKEIHALFPVMVEACNILLKKNPDITFALALSPTLSEEVLEGTAYQDLPLQVVRDRTFEVMQDADVVMVSSGTATLETGMLGTPMVMMYKVNVVTAFLAKRLVDVEHFAMANIVAGRRVIPELMQDDCTAEKAAAEVQRQLDPGENQKVREALAPIRERLGQPGASQKAARTIMDLLS